MSDYRRNLNLHFYGLARTIVGESDVTARSRQHATRLRRAVAPRGQRIEKLEADLSFGVGGLQSGFGATIHFTAASSSLAYGIFGSALYFATSSSSSIDCLLRHRPREPGLPGGPV